MYVVPWFVKPCRFHKYRFNNFSTFWNRGEEQRTTKKNEAIWLPVCYSPVYVCMSWNVEQNAKKKKKQFVFF